MTGIYTCKVEGKYQTQFYTMFNVLKLY